MWSYYGSKSNLVKYYPPPKHQKIIEPFAGSARYALRYFDREVLLVDKYEVIVKIWKWLQKCSPSDILGLPKMKKADNIRAYNLSEDEELFLGMLCGASATSPRFKVSPFTAEKNGYKNLYINIANKLHRIKHWDIQLCDYLQIDNQEATWFIDPPYQHGGHAYVHSNKDIDFKELAKWSTSRYGQVIVCENTKADWMPFYPLIKNRGSSNTTTEAIWTNELTSIGVRSGTLF